MKWFEGKKTYVAAGALLVLAILGFWFGELDGFQAGVLLTLALGFFGVRSAMAAQYAQMILHATDAAKTKSRHKPLTDEQKAQLVQDGKEVVSDLAGGALANFPSLPGQGSK